MISLRAPRSIRLIALLALLSPPLLAATPCSTDDACDDGDSCNGVETCGYGGECRAGIGLCGSPAGFAGSTPWGSSRYGGAYDARNAFDGVVDPGSSWCAAPGDAAPTIALAWALDVEVSEIRVRTTWSPARDFLVARFRIFDASGTTVFDSGSTALTNGEATVPIDPPVLGARRVEMVGESWMSQNPCLSELEIDGGAPCADDSACRFDSPCIAVGMCAANGICTATAPRCRNLSFSHESIAASTEYNATYRARKVADGIDDTGHSWCAKRNDAAPAVRVELPGESPIHLLRVTNPWSSYDFKTARLTIEDSAGQIVYDSGASHLHDGETRVVPQPLGVRGKAIAIEGITFASGPCVGEFQIGGEYCGIEIEPGDPLTLLFRPGVPVPEFEVRHGLVSDLLADGGFDDAACLGRFADASVEFSLPDPPPGDAAYVIARGLNVCQDEGYGLSHGSTGPRDALALEPECAPASR